MGSPPPETDIGCYLIGQLVGVLAGGRDPHSSRPVVVHVRERVAEQKLNLIFPLI